MLVALVSGWGRRPRWHDGRQVAIQVPPLKPPYKVEASLLSSYASVWEQPLFAEGRRPAAVPAPDSTQLSLEGVELTGTVMAEATQVAMLRDSGTNKDVRVKRGQDFRGWTLVELSPRRAVFEAQGRQAELVLHSAVGAQRPQETGRTSGSDAMATEPAASTSSHGVPTARELLSTVNVDDTARREAELNALKAAVLKRRQRPSSPAEAH